MSKEEKENIGDIIIDRKQKIREICKKFDKEDVFELLFPIEEKVYKILEDHAFAPLIGVICDWQIKSQLAYEIPLWFIDKLGSLEPDIVLKKEENGIRNLLESYFIDFKHVKCPPNKWLINTSRYIKNALKYFKDKNTDPIRIFEDTEYSAVEIYFKLRIISGIGIKKASMVVRDFVYRSEGLIKRHPWFDQIKKIRPNFKVTEKEYTIVPVDTHVSRVFRKVFKNILNKRWEHNDIQLLARYIFPEFPAKVDFLFWYVGRKYCKGRKPMCSNCPLMSICDSVV